MGRERNGSGKTTSQTGQGSMDQTAEATGAKRGGRPGFHAPEAAGLGLVAQALLVAVGTHALFPLMLVDLGLSPFFEGSHGR